MKIRGLHVRVGLADGRQAILEFMGIGTVRGHRTFQIRDHPLQARAGRVIGGFGGGRIIRPYRSDHRNRIVHGVEYGDHRRTDELPVRHVDMGRVLVWNGLGQAYGVVAEIAEETGGHRRHALGQIYTGFGEQGAERGQGPVRHGDGTGLECARVIACLAVDFRHIPPAAPDQVRTQPDEGITAANGPALDGFEQEAVGLTLRQLDHRRDRRFQIGNQPGRDDLRLAPAERFGKRREIGREFDHC